MKRLLTRPNALIVLFFIFISSVYIHHVTRDVYSGDIGDLATAAYLLGVPHPPGYPTLTMLGFLFSRLPLPLPIISKISLVSVVAAVTGLVFFFRFARGISKSLFISMLATAMLAFSYLYWLYAEIPEVFALSNCFLILIYYFAWRFYTTKKVRDLYLTALFCGLSLTNQQAILAALPGMFLFIVPHWKMLWKKKKTLIKAVGVGLVGLLPYLYLPLAAAANPQINWMQEPTITNFFRMLTRADYEFAENLVGIDQRMAVMKIYLESFLTNYSWIGLSIGIIGFMTAYRMGRQTFFALIAGFMLCGPLFIFTITPGITDQDELGVLERFFMHSYVLFAFFLPFGLLGMRLLSLKLLKVLKINARRQHLYATIFLIPLLIVPIQMFRYTGQKTDLSTTHIGKRLVQDLLAPLPQNAVILLNSDTPTFNSWFEHYVIGYRPDVTFISGGGDRNDLKKELLKQYKGPLKREAYNKKADNAIVAAMLPEVAKTRPVFSNEIIRLSTKDYVWVARGIVYELTPVSKVTDENEYVKLAQSDIAKLRPPHRERLAPNEQNLITPNIPRLYANAMVAIGDTFYIAYGNPRRAVSYYRYAGVIDPDNSVVYAKMGIAMGELPNQCKHAVGHMDTAIAMYRIYKPYYTFALRVYQQCKAPQQKIDDLKIRYKALFGKDLEKDPHY